jgi:hypothetical protein
MKFVPNKISRAVFRTALKTRKNSPKLMFGAGIVGVLGGTALACKATLQLPETLDTFQDEVDAVRGSSYRVENPQDSYSERDYQKDMLYVYGKNSLKVAKLYAPSVVVGAASIASLTGSHVTLQRRNASLTAAFAGMAKAYDEYRQRVQQELGPDRELDIYHGAENKLVVLPNGNKEIIKTVDPNRWSNYARVFDESCSAWEKSAAVNRLFVQTAQTYFNNRLQIRGHVFLNEVYDHFGFDHTEAGAIVGWIIGSDGDNYIDFGIFDAYNSAFVNEQERSIILDFNVDGIIYDKLGRKT